MRKKFNLFGDRDDSNCTPAAFLDEDEDGPVVWLLQRRRAEASAATLLQAREGQEAEAETEAETRPLRYMTDRTMYRLYLMRIRPCWGWAMEA